MGTSSMVGDFTRSLWFPRLEGEAISCQFCGGRLEMMLIADRLRVPEPCGCPGALRAFEMGKAADDAERSRRLRREDAERRVAHCGVGRRFMGARVPDELSGYIAEAHGRGVYYSLMFSGGRGSGKTHAASAVVLDAARHGKGALFCTSRDITDEIKAGFGMKGGEKEVIRRYTSLDLLAIDDLGKERMTPWALSQLFSVVDGLYRNDASVIVTTEHTYDGLAGRWVESTGDRTTAEAILSRLGGMFVMQLDMGTVDRRRAGQTGRRQQEGMTI